MAEPAHSVIAERWPRWVAAGAGFVWFLLLGGGHALVPTNLDWLMREDWVAHLTGWLFFRNARWQFPLGSAPDLFYPYGTSVAFTDANPWLAFAAKLLSPILPRDFQYVGLWLCLCFMLLGYVGARLTSVFTKNSIQQALGGVLCLLTPVVPARFGHPTLCAHWLLVAALWLGVRTYATRRESWRGVASVLTLVALAAGFHVYWVVMVGGFAAALLLRLLVVDRLLRWQDALAGLSALLAIPCGVMLLFGYFSGVAPSLGAEGFGQFSSDLTAFFNPGDFSRLFTAIRLNPRQGEGYAYLGLGSLALLAFSAGSLFFRRPNRRAWAIAAPVAAASLVMLVYAWSSIVTWKGRPVANLSSLYDHLPFVTQPFRASGRFAWPMHYAFIAAALSSLKLWESRRALATAAVAAAVLLQLCDVDFHRSMLFRSTPFSPLQSTLWRDLSKQYAHIALFPVQAQWVCAYNEPVITRLAYLAYSERMTFNSGYASRTPEEIGRRCDERMSPGGVDDQTVYFPQRKETLRDFLYAGASCGMVERIVACVSSTRPTPFRDALQSPGYAIH